MPAAFPQGDYDIYNTLSNIRILMRAFEFGPSIFLDPLFFSNFSCFSKIIELLLGVVLDEPKFPPSPPYILKMCSTLKKLINRSRGVNLLKVENFQI